MKLLEAKRLDLIPLIIISCCVLHNICLDGDDLIDLDLEAEMAEERLLQPINPQLVLLPVDSAETKRRNISNLLYTRMRY